MNERKTNISNLKGEFRNILLAWRVVHDRPIGTFEHNVESIEQNSFGVISLPTAGDVGLISKTRNYSTTPYDVMVSCLTDDISAIYPIETAVRNEFFCLLADVYDSVERLSGMKVAIGLNQHPFGFSLPEVSPLGQKMRVQTLKPLHAHIYEVSSQGDKTIKMGELPREDQWDMCDPLLLVSGEIIQSSLVNIPGLQDYNPQFDLSITRPPLGLNILVDGNFSNFLTCNSAVLSAIQAQLSSIYSAWSQLYVEDGGQILPVEERIHRVNSSLKCCGGAFSSYTRRVITAVARNLRDASQAKPGRVFINGVAITYTLVNQGAGQFLISAHPRLMSRGNSADAFCLYIDNKEDEDEVQLQEKRCFYRDLIEDLSKKYSIQQGQFL
jgi:hypothetical protein